MIEVHSVLVRYKGRDVRIVAHKTVDGIDTPIHYEDLMKTLEAFKDIVEDDTMTNFPDKDD